MKRYLVGFVLLGLAFAPATLRAQVDLAAQGSWGDEFDFALGARATLGIPSLPLQLQGSFDYFFPEVDSVTYWELNANAVFLVPVPGPLVPYGGAGVNLAVIEIEETVEEETIKRSDTEFGVNLLGGAKYSFGSWSPYAEARYAGGAEQFLITVGVAINVGPGLTPVN